jgi:hypothetical protein
MAKEPTIPTEKVDAFCAAYVATGGNGTEAARRVGYEHKSASGAASRLLARPDVQERLLVAAVAMVDELTIPALSVCARLMRDEDIHPKIQLSAAQALLDRGQLKRGATLEHSVAVDPSALIREIEQAREIKQIEPAKPEPLIIEQEPARVSF